MAKTVLFGRYRLIEAAGSGGSAEVWRAVDMKTGDEVAVKRLHPIVFADESARRRLKREFEALRGLDEPHVVRVRDLRIERNDAALILDYVPGRSLAERLASGEPIAPAQAIDIATDIGAALSAAHAAGIVHRDVTPGNILLDPNDGARLTDFGIALGGGADSVTATGELMGTLRYLAPEQLRGEPATPSTDLHSLAAVIYEMLAGRQVYAAATPVSLAEAQARGPEPIAGVPVALDAVVRRALSRDASDRPVDVASFVAELSAAMASNKTIAITGLPAELGAHTPTASASDGEPEPGAGAGLAVDAGPIWAPAAIPAGAGPVADEAPAGAPRSRRSPPVPLAAVLALVVAGILLAALAPTQRPEQVVSAPRPSTSPTASLIATPSPSAEIVAKPKGQGDKKGKGHGGGKGGGD